MATSSCLPALQNFTRLLQSSHLSQIRFLVVQLVPRRQPRGGVCTRSCVTEDLHPPNCLAVKLYIPQLHFYNLQCLQLKRARVEFC